MSDATVPGNDHLVIRIAQIIDYPSLYMGGPSHNSMRIAAEIVKCCRADLTLAPEAAQVEAVPVAYQKRLDDGEWGTIFHAPYTPRGDHRPLYAAPPAAPAPGIAEARRAFEEIRELNMSGVDENGHRWANSDLIDQTVAEGLIALRALKGGDANV